jgi:hypothetical protein
MNEAVEAIRIQNEIAANAFFHDFRLFLAEAGRKPFPLTNIGNLRLADIHYLGERFALDIYRRDHAGEVWHTIRSERDVLYLTRMRCFAEGMRLTAPQHGKLRLTLRGKAFLATTSPLTPFEQFILWYLQRYDWGAWYDWRADIARALQQAQRFLWRYFLYRHDSRIAFPQFLSGVRRYFGLDALVDESSDLSDSVQRAVEEMLIKDLRLFGLLAVESHTWGSWSHEEAIDAFEPTALGIHIFQLALRTQA